MNMLTQNPTNTRLKYIWDKQKPKPHPFVMLDVISALALRLKIPLVDRLDDAARRGDPKFYMALSKWFHDDYTYVDTAFVNALMAMVVEMPEFRKAHPFDGLVQWFTKEMDVAYRGSGDFEKHGSQQHLFTQRYEKLRLMLGSEDALVQWFEKKKPDLTKLDVFDVFDAVKKFEEDRQPETVYSWKDGWKIVKLATRTQIQKEGDALDNCLQAGSSYTEGYCKSAEAGKSEFFSLRNKAGESVLTIQWSPGEKTPEQVYGKDNTDPGEEEGDRVEEWAKSRGGTYKPKRFGRLSGSALELAEFIDTQSSYHDDDDDIAHAADRWDNLFSLNEAKQWITAIGSSSYDEAERISGAGLSPDEYSKLGRSVHEYINDGHTRDAEAILHMGLLASLMESAGRAPRPMRKVPEGQERLPFESEVFDAKPDPEPEPVTFPRRFEPVEDEIEMLSEAKRWIDAGWNEKDDFEDIVIPWWKNWFTPDDALFFVQETAEYTRMNGQGSFDGISLKMALELRELGIHATDIVDAIRLTPTIINLRDLDAIVSAVERTRLKNNSRRRSSRRSRAR